MHGFWRGMLACNVCNQKVAFLKSAVVSEIQQMLAGWQACTSAVLIVHAGLNLLVQCSTPQKVAADVPRVNALLCLFRLPNFLK